MGPATAHSTSTLPSRPKFSWDIRSPPWTDGKGNQDEYVRSVRQWCRFHDGLSDANSNKITPVLRGICLSSQLYGRAKDLCIGLSSDQLSADNGVDMILAKIHQRDPITVVSEVYRDFTDLIATRRGANESFRNFESRYTAQVSK